MDIRVKLVDLDGRSGPAILPDDVPVHRLVVAIVQKLNLPAVTSEGTLLLYGLSSTLDDEFIDETRTLIQAKINNNDTLFLKAVETDELVYDLLQEDLEIEINILGNPIFVPHLVKKPVETSLQGRCPDVAKENWQRLILVCVGIITVCFLIVLLFNRFVFFCFEGISDPFCSNDAMSTAVPIIEPIAPPETAVSSPSFNFDLIQVEGFLEPENLVAFRNRLYLTAVNPETNSVELWRTNGTIANMQQVSRFNEPNKGISELTIVEEQLFFLRNDAELGSELWVSDGLLPGTELVKDLWIGELGSLSTSLTVWKDKLSFTINDSEYGVELWQTDGTEFGTAMIKDIHASGSSMPTQLTVVGNSLFFMAEDGLSREVWVTDGTEVGTVAIEDLNRYPASPSSVSLANRNGRLILLAAGEQKYMIPRVTLLAPNTWVNNLYIQLLGVDIIEVVTTNNGLFVTVADINGRSLWFVSDSPYDSFSEPIPVIPVIANDQKYNLFSAGDIVYFSAQDPKFGNELWQSNGTETGTFMVNDINSEGDSDPIPLGHVDEYFFFEADDGLNGRGLWVTNGVKDNVVLITNPEVGLTGGNIVSFTVVGGDIYFVNEDIRNGRQLWRLAWGD